MAQAVTAPTERIQLRKSSIDEPLEKRKRYDSSDSDGEVPQKFSKNGIIQHQEKLKIHYYDMVAKRSYRAQESGLHSDFYSVDTFSSSLDLFKKEKHRKTKFKPRKQSLQTAWPDTQISSDSDSSSDSGSNSTFSDLPEHRDFSWFIHLRLPDPISPDSVNGTIEDGFSFTGAIMTDNLYEGLLHSLVRHWDQWTMFIPELSDTFVELESIAHYRIQIQNAPDKLVCERAMNEFIKATKQLDSETFEEISSGLYDAQMKLYEFIQKNIKLENYLKSGVDIENRIQTYFKVSGRDDYFMVVCVSNHLYPNVEEFADDVRPIREITTVYFLTADQYYEEKDYLSDDSDESDDDDECYDHKNGNDGNGSHGGAEHDNDDDVQRRTKTWEDHKNLAEINDAEKYKGDHDKVQELSDDEINNKIQIENRTRDAILFENLTKESLHVRMPNRFGYTCAILTNNLYQGLLHIFFRHWHEFVDWIPFLRTLEDVELFPIKTEMQNLRQQNSPRKKFYEKLRTAIKNKTNLTSTLIIAQWELYKHIKNNVEYERYWGEGVNENLQIQVYFSKDENFSKDNPSNVLSMAVCLKPEIYDTSIDFKNSSILNRDINYFKRIVTTFHNSDFYDNFYIGTAWLKQSINFQTDNFEENRIVELRVETLY